MNKELNLYDLELKETEKFLYNIIREEGIIEEKKLYDKLSFSNFTWYFYEAVGNLLNEKDVQFFKNKETIYYAHPGYDLLEELEYNNYLKFNKNFSSKSFKFELKNLILDYLESYLKTGTVMSEIIWLILMIELGNKFNFLIASILFFVMPSLLVFLFRKYD